MNIPKIWEKAESKITGPRGPMALVAWGWSDDDREQAARVAQERLQRLISRVRSSIDLERDYVYGSRPFREEIRQEVVDRSGARCGLVTRNSYGSLVLNTADVMFVDIDLPKAGVADRILSVFKKASAAEGEFCADLKRRIEAASTASYRVYRTAAGYRLLFTDRLFKPGSSETEMIMGAVSADPAYIKLCRLQESFRARLTPKPWRCGAARPPGQYPRTDESERQQFDAWLANYEKLISTKGTCRFLDAVNRGWVHERVQPILDLHDRATKASANLTLA